MFDGVLVFWGHPVMLYVGSTIFEITPPLSVPCGKEALLQCSAYGEKFVKVRETGNTTTIVVLNGLTLYDRNCVTGSADFCIGWSNAL